MLILGINAYHEDSSACLVRDGKIICAIEEERIRRIKHWAGFPSESIKACLEEAGVTIGDVDHIGMADPLVNGRPSCPKILAEILGVKAEHIKAKFHSIEHHVAHMASAFLVSGFDKAAVFSIDGFGDFRSAAWSMEEDSGIKMFNKAAFPHSLGMLYTAFTQYLGFLRYGDEYKVMGLAPYGKPVYLDKFRSMAHCNEGGVYELDLDYFAHHKISANMLRREGEPVVEKIYSGKLIKEFGSERTPDAQLTQHHKDIAASLQAFLEEAELALLNILYRQTKLPNLCIAGSVGFNSVANGKILSNTHFKNIFIQPAAGDSGTSLGAAYYIYNVILKYKRDFVMEHAYLGNEYTDEEIESILKKYGLAFTYYKDAELCQTTAALLSEEKVVGWFQGRMEFGPRALGNRSILADPRKAEMKDILNSRVKHRETFRPFAPSVLEEYAGDYSESATTSPYMLMVYKVPEDKQKVIPAVTHYDGTSRIQTVSKKTNLRFWSLINEFKKITGVPVLLNTSFNENEPIVYSPGEAVECFLRTKMDALVLGNYLCVKK